MAMTDVLRPGFIQLRVLDLDEAIVHYRDRIGLDLVEVAPDGRVYLKAYDEFDRHSVVLRQADESGVDFVAFKVASEAVLDVLAGRLENAGIATTEIPEGEAPGVGRRVRFHVPTGHRLELYATIAMSANGPMTENPDLWRTEPRGMRALRFDHCLLHGQDIDGTAKILTDVLGFANSEVALAPDGKPVAIFLSCSMKAHDIALVRHDEDGKLHHVSFLLESWSDIGHAADLIAQHDIPLDIGPTRHGATRGQTIYFFDPSGNRNEVFAGGYQYYPDNPTRIWTGDQAGKAIFYYEKKLNDTFLSVVT
jgi:catechol 2,3-dioxygenase